MTTSPSDVADQAAEAIRTLNHITSDALEYPSDVYEVVANMKIMTQRLPQLFDQLSAWLEREYAAGHISHDRGWPAEDEVRSAVDSLTLASMGAGALTDALNTAHNALGGLKAAGR
jgi:hypothetical protein